jgi:segregation and condensation protein A
LESSLTKACQLKIQNFEGPFDLLFHLIEKNQMSLYDIPINDITDQYMDYLFAMQELDLEIASEFLVMAATLLHIKSRMLLPDKKEKPEEVDPREELILRLVQYKKYKEFSTALRLREKEWDKLVYKLPEVIEFIREDETLELSPEELKRVYTELLEKNKRKMNNNAGRMAQLIQHEKVSLRSKIREIVKQLLSKTCFIFSDIFNLKVKSKTEVVTGFLAMLELSKLKKVRLEQNKQFSDIVIHRTSDNLEIDEEQIAAEH